MEQRVYHGGNPTPDGLADYLVQSYQPNDRYRAQKLGQGDSLIVQIGRSDRAEPAITIGIHRDPQETADLIVTLGEQQWLSPEFLGYGAVAALVGVLFTPWALFGLIWPLAHIVEEEARVRQTWELIGTYLGSQGATMAKTQDISHPHINA